MKILPFLLTVTIMTAAGTVKLTPELLGRAITAIVSVNTALDKSDIIIVFAGGSGRRMEHAAELAEAGYARKILVLGTEGEKQIARSILGPWLNGRDVELLLPKENLPDTFSSAKFAAAYIETNRIKKAMIVSDNWHLRRISLLMEDYGNKQTKLMYSHPVSQIYRWWKKVDKTALLAKECAKIAICTVMVTV